MADDKSKVQFPFRWEPGIDLSQTPSPEDVSFYQYDPETRELRYGDRVIGYADLAGNFQVEPEYEEFVRNNPIPWGDTNKPNRPHMESAQNLQGSLLRYHNRENIWTREGSVVPPMDKKTLQSQHASVMIGNRAGLMDLATNKVYDRISMKELGEVGGKGVLQLNQTTSKLPEYAELRGKPVRKQIPPRHQYPSGVI